METCQVNIFHGYMSVMFSKDVDFFLQSNLHSSYEIVSMEIQISHFFI